MSDDHRWTLPTEGRGSNPTSVSVSAYALEQSKAVLSAAGRMTYDYLSSVDYRHYACVTLSMGRSAANWIMQGYGSLSEMYIQGRNKYDSCGTPTPTTSACSGDLELPDITCSICLEKGKSIVLIPCGHTFCKKCPEKLLECPICRSHINGHMKFFL